MEGFLKSGCILPICGCIALSAMYVLSLYVWQNPHLRNDPAVIKKKFFSVFVTSVLSPFAIYIFSSSDLPSKHSIFDLLGLRYSGLFMAATVPLILTMVLFLGPLSMQSQTDNWDLYSEAPEQDVSPAEMPITCSECVASPFTVVHGVDDNSVTLKSDNNVHKVLVTKGHLRPSVVDNSQDSNELPLSSLVSTCPLNIKSNKDEFSSPAGIPNNVERDNETTDCVKESEPMYWIDSCKDLIWLRDHVVAPFSEELTFRACMLPLLVQCFRPQSAVFICPLFFGIAHFHHVIGQVKNGRRLKSAILLSGFQFLFTTIFGAYSAFLFLRTGHVIAPFLAHAFCNHIGFPNFREIGTYEEPKRSITFTLCVVGLISWCCLLSPLTNPLWYKNNIYWRV